MSRWREMLMDYGQLMDQNSFRKSHADGSDIFSVDGDLMEKRRAEQGLLRVLEVHFRPLFQNFVYGGEKIACHDLQRVLRDRQYRDRLPPDRVHELADLVDFNMGRSVTYTEFVRIVMGRNVPDDTISFASDRDSDAPGSRDGKTPVLATVCRNTGPQVQVEETVANYYCCPPAFFVISVTIVQIVLYIVYADNKEPLEGDNYNNELIYRPDRRREAWRFVTYCFMHDGYVDLIFNVVLQLVFGVPLEIIFSFWRIMIVYFAGVITGSIGHSVVDHYSSTSGAAGGCYAILTANVVSIIFNWSNYNKVSDESSTKRMCCHPALRILIMLLLVCAQTALAFYRRFGLDNGVGGVAVNFGGIVAGVSMSSAFLQDNKRYPWHTGGGIMNLFMFLFLIGGGIVFNIAYPHYPPEAYP